MRGVIFSGLLLAAMGCTTVGKVGVDTGGMVRLASDCGVADAPTATRIGSLFQIFRR